MSRKLKRQEKRRNELSKILNKINIFIFVATLIMFSVLSVIIPKKTVSEIEKRELAKFPKYTKESLFSGEYFKGIENFYNDTFPFRDKFLQIASHINESKGIRQGEDEIKLYK